MTIEQKQLPAIPESALSKLILKGDIGQLSDLERVVYYKSLCERLGLDPLTKPFDYLTLQGKMMLYLNKGGAEQLNKKHSVSIAISSTKETESVYIGTSRATSPDGRYAEATGVVAIKGLNGNDLCNAMMRAETKAARRATIRLLGLAMLDESEALSIPGAIIEEAKIVDQHTGEVINSEELGRRKLVSKEELEIFFEMASSKGFSKASVRDIIYDNFKEVRPNNINETLTHEILHKTNEILEKSTVINNED